jgi:hypothetical protein
VIPVLIALFQYDIRLGHLAADRVEKVMGFVVCELLTKLSPYVLDADMQSALH